MEHNATSAIDEALDRTKTLLWPPRTGIWVRITIIAIFLGGGIINPIRTEPLESGIPAIPGPEVFTGYMELFLTIVTGLIVAGVIYVIISSTLQFIFVDCLSTGTIILTRTLRLRWWKGIRLVGFYLILLSVIIISLMLLSFLIIIPGMQTEHPDLATLLILLIQTLIAALIVLIPVWLIAILTADFVVPVMIVDDCGIIAGWKKTLSLFSGKWRVAVIYAGLKILLVFITGMFLGVIIFLISIPLGIAGAIMAAETTIPPSTNQVGIGMVVAGTGVMFLISLLLLVPVITFFRYYSLVVLRDLNPDYNLLTDNPST